MSGEYLIKEINEDLKKLTEILNNYYDNYDINLIEDVVTCIKDEHPKRIYHIKVTYTQEIGV